MFGVVGVTPGATMVLFYVYIPFLYPAVNMTLAVLGAIPIALIFGATYYLLAASMPRTGGDYIYGSRIIHPLWGFLPNWMYCFVNVSALGFYATTVGGANLGPFFAIMGSFYNNPTLLSWASAVATVNGSFIVALVLIWVSALINIFGIRAYAKAQLLMFVVAMIGTIALLGLLAVSNNQGFQAAFNAHAAPYNTTYTGMIQLATQAGWHPQSFDLTSTFLALPYIAGFSLATVWAVIPAGEAKTPQKSLLYGTVIAIAISGVIMLLGAIFFYNVVGDQFAKALAYISNCGCTTNPLPVGPYIQYLTAMLTDNPALVFILAFAFFIWGIILLPAFYLITTRPMFAWSFDRLVPTFLADVSDRFHVPLKSIILVAVLASLMAALSEYTTYVGYAFNLTLATVSSFVFAGVAAVFFPYVKRARGIYELAPSIVRKKIAGIPLVTIFGALEAIIFGYLTYIDGTSPALSGPINPASLGIIVIMYLAAVVIYFGAKAYHKRHGLDIGLVYKELPPE
jgi:amino acid transporter